MGLIPVHQNQLAKNFENWYIRNKHMNVQGQFNIKYPIYICRPKKDKGQNGRLIGNEKHPNRDLQT